MIRVPIFTVPLARSALMIEDCESVTLLTPRIDSKRLQVAPKFWLGYEPIAADFGQPAAACSVMTQVTLFLGVR
jgi:hypothetical protein